jgi:exopolyphosphatase/guanosine-5'-triphosphate,3'-diphosphate pyrophosphatase
VIALLARYHRRAVPSRDHTGYRDLSSALRRTVRILSAFLRLAETLDRSQHGLVKAINIRDRGGDMRLQLKATGDAELEVWAANRQVGVLEDELGRRIRIEVHAVPEEEARKLRPRRRYTELTARKPERNRRRIA